MKTIINLFLLPFSRRHEMAPGCWVRYVDQRPVAAKASDDGLFSGWVIL